MKIAEDLQATFFVEAIFYVATQQFCSNTYLLPGFSIAVLGHCTVPAATIFSTRLMDVSWYPMNE